VLSTLKKAIALFFPLPYEYICYSQYWAVCGCWYFNIVMLLGVFSGHDKMHVFETKDLRGSFIEKS
jgi:hypothetical protein